MSKIRLPAVALALALPCLAACSGLHPVLLGEQNETAFRVYDLGEMVSGPLDDSEHRVLSSMIRDAVGPNEWLSANSSMHVLDDAMLIRTTTRGHDNLSSFFIQFRTINDSR
jgi:hypothetical protein